MISQTLLIIPRSYKLFLTITSSVCSGDLRKKALHLLSGGFASPVIVCMLAFSAAALALASFSFLFQLMQSCHLKVCQLKNIKHLSEISLDQLSAGGKVERSQPHLQQYSSGRDVHGIQKTQPATMKLQPETLLEVFVCYKNPAATVIFHYHFTEIFITRNSIDHGKK